MDHMMPKMDGIETTEKLREMGYKGAIVALTANALVGNDALFSQHGFDGFIPKPINVRYLNTILNKFIRDRHPEEAKKYKPRGAVLLPAAASQAVFPKTDLSMEKLLQIFCSDAEKAVSILRQTSANGNIKLFTITVHAMKSALMNVGEPEISEQAKALEQAGFNGDTDFIAANVESFTQNLVSLIKKHNPAKNTAANNADMSNADMLIEDTAYLKKYLQNIKEACEDYDDTAVYAALDRLKEKQWKMKTTSALEKIHDMLFLDSDFDQAAKHAEIFLMQS